jgi:hypothetical protein
MPAVLPIVTAVVSAYAANKAASSNEHIAQMNIDANKANKASMIPLASDQDVQNAKRKSIMDQIAGRGRAGTLLSDSASSDKLGGG